MANNNINEINGNLTNYEIRSNGKPKSKIREDLPDFIIYSHGQIRNLLTGNMINENPRKYGYITVSLRGSDGKRHAYPLHRLIYETFIGEIPHGYQINHIDENKMNNTILFDELGHITYTNLEIVTPKQNCNYGSRNERISAACVGKPKSKNKFKVIITPLGSGEVYEEFYNTVTELCKAHPTQERMTWAYRLRKSKKALPLYTAIEDEKLLQIYPLNEEYQERLNQQKGEQA